MSQTEWRCEDAMEGVDKVVTAIRDARETVPFPDDSGIRVRCNVDAIGSGWGCHSRLADTTTLSNCHLLGSIEIYSGATREPRPDGPRCRHRTTRNLRPKTVSHRQDRSAVRLLLLSLTAKEFARTTARRNASPTARLISPRSRTATTSRCTAARQPPAYPANFITLLVLPNCT